MKKIPAWDKTKVRNKSEVIDEARTKGIKVHFASLMDLCHLKSAELETKHQKYKGRVVLRGNIVKDDSGSYAVFTEQGSSASHMSAAKVMDIISRLPGCAGQAADAISAYSQVKMEDAPKLLKIPKSECPDIWIRLPRHKCPKSSSSMEDLVVLLERNLYDHPLAGLLWERQFEKILFKHGWEKVLNWECLFVHREKGLFLSVYVDDIKLAGKKQNLDPMWKLLNKEVDLGEPTSFLDHLYLGCTQRQCQLSKDIVDNLQNHVRIANFRGGSRETAIPSKSSYFFSWTCKKQTSVSHSSTESAIISLDAGLRLDGIPALDWRDLIVAVLHGNTYQSDQERRDPCTNQVRAAPSDQDDFQGKEPDNETCFQNPQSCS